MRTYAEEIYNNCKNTNFDDKEEAIRLAQWLAGELSRFHRLSLMQDEKLQELMPAKDYNKWAIASGNQLFFDDINAMPNSDFKQIILDYYDDITK